MDKNKGYEIFHVIHLIEVYADIKNGIFKSEEDYLTDENSILVLGNEYYHQFDDISEELIEMVEKDIEEAMEDDFSLGSGFKKREELRKKFYKELGFDYKPLTEFLPDIRFF